jgi:phospholipid-binding lipoprotein MlaA
LNRPERTAVARLAGLIVALALLPACATRPPANDPIAVAQYKKVDDPLEPMNRTIYKFNNAFYEYFFGPITTAYRTIFPKVIRDGARNFLFNLDAPIVFLNDVLQAQGKRATDTLGRFVLNSTVGVGGFFDPATDLGIPWHDEDFGQTLAVYGIKDGGYIMIPVYGPSSTRDGFGLIVDLLADPVSWILSSQNVGYLGWPRLGARGIDKYDRNQRILDDLRENSVDGYVALRSYYRQNRDFEIRNGKQQSKQEQQQQNELFDKFDDESQ